MSEFCRVGTAMTHSNYSENSLKRQSWKSEVGNESAPLVWVVVQIDTNEEVKKNFVIFGIPNEYLDNDFQDEISLLFNGGLHDLGDEIGAYHLFAAENASKSELKNLKNIHGILPKSMSLLIHPVENMKLTVFCCDISPVDLSLIYRQNKEPPCQVGDIFRGTDGYKFSAQVMESSLSLCFNEDADASNEYFFRDSLIHDLPIGMRLFSALRQARYKEK